jgi:hypothetical protein
MEFGCGLLLTNVRKRFSEDKASKLLFHERPMNSKGKDVLNEVSLQITLIRSTVAFCLMATGGQPFKVGITAASILIRKIKLSPPILLAHANSRERNGQISKSAYSLQIVHGTDRIFGGKLREAFFGQPSVRPVVGLVNNRAYNGARERNPFNFQYFSLMEIGIYLTGHLLGSKLVKLEFAANRYVATYAGMFGGTNKINRGKGTTSTDSITPEDSAVCIRLDCGSRRKRSRECVSAINRSIELEIRRGTGALDHRRPLCRVREHGRNQPESQHRSRFQQLINMTDIGRLSCSDGAYRQISRGVFTSILYPIGRVC